MTIQKIETVESIEILKDGCVNVFLHTVLENDGKAIHSSFLTHTILPGADYSNEPERVKAVCAVVHTADVIDAFRSAQEPLPSRAQLIDDL
jgi:hypothetical protein